MAKDLNAFKDLSMKCLLFAYGALRPYHKHAPKSLSGYEKDSISGDLFETPKGYLLGTNIGSSIGRIKGYTLEINEKELKSLDKLEGRSFFRVQTETRNGHLVYAYEYIEELPDNAILVNKNTF